MLAQGALLLVVDCFRALKWHDRAFVASHFEYSLLSVRNRIGQDFLFGLLFIRAVMLARLRVQRDELQALNFIFVFAPKSNSRNNFQALGLSLVALQNAVALYDEEIRNV